MAVAMAFVQAPASPPPPLASLLAGQRVALYVDFDGTLVEIASSPGGIAVPPDLGARLEALADRLGQALALVSGRAVRELLHHLGTLPIHLAGSHGAHVVAPDGTVLLEHQPLPHEVTTDLQAFACNHGLLYEPKPHGAALHYRTRPEREQAARAFAHDLAQRHTLQIKHGKCVTELVRPGASKGAAVHLLHARTPFAGALPIFIGDDLTDEDGFLACNQMGGFGIVVGNRRETAAQYRLASVDHVYEWLTLCPRTSNSPP